MKRIRFVFRILIFIMLIILTTNKIYSQNYQGIVEDADNINIYVTNNDDPDPFILYYDDNYDNKNDYDFTNPNSPGVGSLRWAMNFCYDYSGNKKLNILFNIPNSNTIIIKSSLPALLKGGSIKIDGYNLSTHENCILQSISQDLNCINIDQDNLYMYFKDIEIKNLYFKNFSKGISIGQYVDNNSINNLNITNCNIENCEFGMVLGARNTWKFYIHNNVFANRNYFAGRELIISLGSPDDCKSYCEIYSNRFINSAFAFPNVIIQNSGNLKYYSNVFVSEENYYKEEKVVLEMAGQSNIIIGGQNIENEFEGYLALPWYACLDKNIFKTYSDKPYIAYGDDFSNFFEQYDPELNINIDYNSGSISGKSVPGSTIFIYKDMEGKNPVSIGQTVTQSDGTWVLNNLSINQNDILQYEIFPSCFINEVKIDNISGYIKGKGYPGNKVSVYKCSINNKTSINIGDVTVQSDGTWILNNLNISDDDIFTSYENINGNNNCTADPVNGIPSPVNNNLKSIWNGFFTSPLDFDLVYKDCGNYVFKLNNKGYSQYYQSDFCKLTWDFGDGSSIEEVTVPIDENSGLINFPFEKTHNYPNSDNTYTVKLKITYYWEGFSNEAFSTSIIKEKTVAIHNGYSLIVSNKNVNVGAQLQLTYVYQSQLWQSDNYSIDYGDGTTATGSTTNNSNLVLTHSYSNPGIYYPEIKFFSGAQQVYTCNTEITVHVPTGCLISKRNDFNRCETLTNMKENRVYLNIKYNDNQSIKQEDKVRWDFGDGTYSNEFYPDHTYKTQGDYTINASLIKADGSQTTCSYLFYASSTTPLIKIETFDKNGVPIGNSIDGLGSEYYEGEEITYRYTLSDINVLYQDGTTFQWDFGDGFIQNEIYVNHEYSKKGSNMKQDIDNSHPDKIIPMILEIKHTYNESGNMQLKLTYSAMWDCGKVINIKVKDSRTDDGTTNCCLSTFAASKNKTYVLSGWVKVGENTNVTSNQKLPNIKDKPSIIVYLNSSTSSNPVKKIFVPDGPIIEGWQRIEGEFQPGSNDVSFNIELKNPKPSTNVYFDDIRIYPLGSTMKSYVWDYEKGRLSSELDENNYATFYEYDDEGELVRIKKETEKGIFTLKETRKGFVEK